MTQNLRRFFSLPLFPFVGALAMGAAAGGMDRWVGVAAISFVFLSLLGIGYTQGWTGLPGKALWAVVGCFAIAFISVYTLLHPTLPGNHVVNFAGRKAWIVEGQILPPLDPGLDHSQITIGVRALLTHDQHRYPACGRLRVSVYGPYIQTLYVGDIVRFVSAISRPHPPANPFSFNYRRFLSLRRIYATAKVNDFSQFVVFRRDSHDTWIGAVNRLRQHLDRWITASIPAPYNALAAAFLIGYRGQVSHSIRDVFIRCGAAHLIAISGLHLGIVSILLFLIIRRLLAFFPRVFLYMDVQRITAALTFLCLLFYLVLTGGRVSTVRAFIMAAAFLSVLFFRRTSRLPDILLLAAFVILFFQPQAIFFVSFQLTFAAVGGILLGVNRREFERFTEEEKKKKTAIRKVTLWVGATLLITILAMAATFPIATYYFHRSSSMALVANLFGVPYAGFVMLPVGLISLIVYPFSTVLATFLLRIDGVLIEGLVRFFQFLASFPHSRIYVSPFRWYEVIFYYGTFIFIVFAFRSQSRRDRKRNGLVATGFAGMLLLSFLISRAVLTPSVTIFSTRQGTYLAAISEDGHATVVCHGLGGSPRRDDARWVLVPYLLGRRIRAIDALIVANNSPVNLRSVVELLGYKTPRYIVGTRSNLYSLRSVCSVKDPHVTWVETSKPMRLGEEVACGMEGKAGFVFTFENLRFLMEFFAKRGKIPPEREKTDVLLTPVAIPVASGGGKPIIIRYPGVIFWGGRGSHKADTFDLRQDGAILLEKTGRMWRVRTFLSHRKVLLHSGSQS